MPKTLYKISKTSFLNKTPEKFWVDEGTEYGETFQKLCTEKDFEIYSTTGETKTAFAERATQS